MALERKVVLDLVKLANVRSLDDGEVLQRSGSTFIGAGNVVPTDPIAYLSTVSIPASSKFVFVDATSGSFVATLPDAADAGAAPVMIKKIDSTANTITVSAIVGQLIDGNATYVLEYANEFVELRSDGSNWYVTGE